MSSERERRKAEARMRKKKTRAAASLAREQRQERERSRAAQPKPSTHLRDTLRWPIKDAWLSSNWDEDGADVHAGLSRRDHEGEGALFSAVFFTVDTTTGLIHDIETLAGVVEGRVNQEVVDRAQSGSMIFCEPTDVAALVADAQRYARAEKEVQEESLEHVTAFLAGIPTDEANYEVHFGDPADDEPTVTPVQRPSLFGGLKKLFGLE